jgi:hypothetical protein
MNIKTIYMMRTILLLIISFYFAVNCFAQKNILDGKSFAIDIVEKNRMGKNEKTKGTITFKDGKVSTNFSLDDGFPEAAYTTTSKDGLMGTTITFIGESKGKKDKLVWEGYVTEDEIEGTTTREKKGEIRTMFEFKGVLK